jgi:AAHS family 4-hydroxybenzoate transporter-like MFS transporter
MNQSIDVTQLIDRQPVGRFLLGVLLLCALVTLADGYNISVAAFAAPAIVKSWSISRSSLGPLFSSSLLAGLIGPFLFGTIADRIGRRSAIIVGTLTIGVFGVVCGLCTSLVPLVISRFFAGIGMSGALAVTVASINEFAPRRLRATFVTVVFSGTTIGFGHSRPGGTPVAGPFRLAEPLLCGRRGPAPARLRGLHFSAGVA